MSRYLARVVQPDGVSRYLLRGRLTDNWEAATHYPHPSNAWQAIAAWKTKHPQTRCYADVVDSRDEERVAA